MADYKRKRIGRKHTSLEESLLNDEDKAVLYELDQSFLKNELEDDTPKQRPSRIGTVLHLVWVFFTDKGVLSIIFSFLLITLGVVLVVLTRQFSLPNGVSELSRYFVTAGVFGIAGGGTNWIAVIMLIYKIPCFIGSGVFYRRNRQIRGVLKNITLQMLFDSKHLETYLERKIAQFSSNAQVVENITQALDSAEGERVIEEELSSLYAQPEAHYLRVLGLGREQLRPLIKPSVLSLCAETAPMVLGAVSNGSSCRNDALSVPLFRKEMEQYLSWRLEELTEKRIGSLMRKLFYKHLGWVIVWGSVFGILTGVVVQGLKISLNFNYFLRQQD